MVSHECMVNIGMGTLANSVPLLFKNGGLQGQNLSCFLNDMKQTCHHFLEPCDCAYAIVCQFPQHGLSKRPSSSILFPELECSCIVRQVTVYMHALMHMQENNCTRKILPDFM